MSEANEMLTAEQLRPLRVYISSSWKMRDHVRSLAAQFREDGNEVYDFTDPKCRKTPEIPPEKYPEQFDPEFHDYADYLSKPEWIAAVTENRKAIEWCDVVVLLLPCGNDAHADWALAVGMGKRSVVVGCPRKGERSPVHHWADGIVPFEQAREWVNRQQPHIEAQASELAAERQRRETAESKLAEAQAVAATIKNPESGVSLGDLLGWTTISERHTLKCLFCDFTGSKQALIEHSAECGNHPQFKRREAAEAALAEAQADTRRLDWLIKQGPPGAAEGMGLNEDTWEAAYSEVGKEREADNVYVRRAIDAAMGTQEDK